MADNIGSLVKKYHAFYEVLPHYVLIEDRHGNLPATTRRVQDGFDIDIYGVRTEDNKMVMPPTREYALGYAGLQKIAQDVSQHTGDSCSLEVMAFPSSFILDARDHAKVEALIRITISQRRGLDQPAGLPEQHALEEVEKQLKSLGVARR